MTMQQLQDQIDQLSTQEKMLVLWDLAHELIDGWPGIEKTPGVQGGDACIVRTRIPVWVLESYRRLGWTDEQILEQYPTLRLLDIRMAWLYVDTHRTEIDQAIQKQEAA